MKKKYHVSSLSLSLFFIVLLITSCFFITSFTHNVKGVQAGYIYTEDFEDHASGEDANEGGWFYSEQHISQFSCDGAGNFKWYRAWDGTGNYPPSGTWNFAYEYDLNIKNISWDIDYDDNADQANIFNFNDSSGQTFLRFYVGYNGGDRFTVLWNWSSGEYDVADDGLKSDTLSFEFKEEEIRFTFHNLDYSLNKTNNFIRDTYDYNDTRLETIYCTVLTAYHEIVLIDDLQVEFRTLVGASLPFNTDGLIQIGSYELGDSTDYIATGGTSSFIEIERNVKMTATIHHVTLKVLVSWLQLWGGTEDDLKLMLNGEDMGKPDGHILIDSDSHLFYWKDIDKALIDENPLFEFRCTNDGFNWYVPEVESDIDSDGDVKYTLHPFSSMFQGFYDDTTSGEVQVIEKEICYSFWYSSLAPPYENEYPYWIDCVPDNVDQYESIYCLYTCPIDVTINLRIYNPSLTLVYDKPVEYSGLQTGQLIYIPSEYGTYNFTLYCVDNLTTMAYKTVIVNEKDYNYLIYTNPNPSKPSGIFDLFYIYNATTFNGIIKIINLNDGLTYFEEDIENKTNTLTKISDISLSVEGIYECKLYINTGASELLKYNYVHLVQDEHSNNVYMGLKNSVGQFTYYTDYETFAIDSDIYFIGSHNFILQDVYLQVLSNKITVGDSWLFEENVPDSITKNSGEYTVYLKVDVNGTAIILDSYSFSIGSGGLETPDVDIITENFDFFIGLGVVLAFTFIGVGIGVKSKTDLLPITLVFSVIGCLIATVLQLIPLYFIFILGILLIAWIVTKLVPS